LSVPAEAREVIRRSHDVGGPARFDLIRVKSTVLCAKRRAR